MSILSRGEPEGLPLKLAAPSAKAKHCRRPIGKSTVRGKGEKDREYRGEIDLKPGAYKRLELAASSDSVPFA